MAIIYTKETLIEKLKDIRTAGWIQGRDTKNDGNVGNTLEDLLGITENNLPIPNAAEWELKAQRKNTASLMTMFHMEPSPRALKLVPKELLPVYGWKHDKENRAGEKYSDNEKSFRMTMNAVSATDRGFIIKIDKNDRKFIVDFDASKVDARHAEWLSSVKRNLADFDDYVAPYWGFDDVFHKAGKKLPNCFYVAADSKIENKREFFLYEKIYKLSHFSLDKFVAAIESGAICIEFDARTMHNHGSKFRMRNGRLPELYDNVEEI
jgi:hypothetical protein